MSNVGRSGVIVTTSVEFARINGWKSTVATLRAAWFASLEDHSFVFASTSYLFKSEPFHVNSIEVVPPEMLVARKPLWVMDFRVYLT